jgi:predicted nucleic acid-binding protein
MLKPQSLPIKSRWSRQIGTDARLDSPIALRAGRIDGQSQAKGVRIPLSDLLIGVSALELGYGVGTANVRHFELIAGLKVIQI